MSSNDQPIDQPIEVTPCKYKDGEFVDYNTDSPTFYFVRVPLGSGPVDMYLSVEEAKNLQQALNQHM